MGRAAWNRNVEFQDEIKAIDRIFKPLSSWSLVTCFTDGLTDERLNQTSVAQPLIFAIQSALTAVLSRFGIRPDAVLGHSLGEVAAAEASGALSRKDAIHLIYRRSQLQERVRGLGRMIVIATGEHIAKERLTAFKDPSLQIAAINGPASITISGSTEALASFAEACRRDRIAAVDIGLDYPFHSDALDDLEEEIVAALLDLQPTSAQIDFYSTVTGGRLSGEALDGYYWWENIRQPVLFSKSIQAALNDGVTNFVEIAPRPIMGANLRDIMRQSDRDGDVVQTFGVNDDVYTDPIGEVFARLVASGINFDKKAAFGSNPARHIPLPPYPFQHQRYTLPLTPEGLQIFGRMIDDQDHHHPLLGARVAADAPEWRSILDIARVPYLADHRVNGDIILPAAAYIEMAFAAGRDLYGSVPLRLETFDVLKPLVFSQSEAREISVRFGGESATIEIWSRKRFSSGSWTLHARGLLREFKHKEPLRLAPPTQDAEVNHAAEVYAEARRASIDYGPHFALVDHVRRTWTTCEAHLRKPSGGLGAFQDIHVLHPASLDASFHGLFVQRPQGEGERITYLPVRFEDVRLYHHGVTVAKSISELNYESSRSKSIALSLFDTQNQIVLCAEKIVFRVVSLSRTDDHDRCFHETATKVYDKPAPFLPIQIQSDAALQDEPSDAWLLTRAFALSLANEIIADYVDIGSELDPSQLMATGKIAASAEPLLETLISFLVQFDVLKEEGRAYRFIGLDDALKATSVLSSLIDRCPGSTFEIRLAANALGQLKTSLRTGSFEAPSKEMLNRYLTSTSLMQPGLDWLTGNLKAMRNKAGCRLHLVAVVGSSPGLCRSLDALDQLGVVKVTYACLNAEARLELEASYGRTKAIDALMIEDLDKTAFHFDALIATVEPYSAAEIVTSIEELIGNLFVGAPVFVLQPGIDKCLDMLCGVWRDWLPNGYDITSGAMMPAESLQNHFSQIGISDIGVISFGEGRGKLLHGRATSSLKSLDHPIAILSSIEEATSYGLEDPKCLGHEISDAVYNWADTCSERGGSLLVPLQMTQHDSSEEVATHIETLKTLFSSLDGASGFVRIYVMINGVNASKGECAAASALRAFVRVAMNEYPRLDIRLIDIRDPYSKTNVAHIVKQSGDEREWRITEDGSHIVRIRRGVEEEENTNSSNRTVLHFSQPGRFESFVWSDTPRAAPREGHIEIEIQSVGLNFRDVMLGLGVLDDEILSAGLTGASLGFECSGFVRRVGAGVQHLKEGDRVMGFASEALASHVTSPAWQFIRIPDGVSVDAAATIPVAFATAWYALIERARLQPGETVLIHGAAGAVGLAAIQIAKHVGATVIGTASDPARHAIALAAGADHVFQSRDERFFDQIKSICGGIDVALNSHSGDAMRATLELMKPFGRFIELGKKDFLDNSLIGLRPFLRNITYAGVDLDELLRHDPSRVSHVMANITDGFSQGHFRTLPYQMFEGYEVGSAFRMMQASEHVGKLLIKPLRAGQMDLASGNFVAEGGPWLVVGGTQGFGFATAKWLAEHGATRLILASRRGEVKEDLIADMDALQARGIQIHVIALDVSNADAVNEAVRDLEKRFGSLRGVIHAAVHLDDGLIHSLEPDRLRNVLRTKIDGVVNLDRATAQSPLQAFVVYSSATTLIGSPGQGAYVAANAFLEGFARMRRARGQVALSMGWGAIGDVGLIARDRELGERLRRTTGVVPLSSDQALAHLGHLLARQNEINPVQYYTNLSAGGAVDKLMWMRSPSFFPLNLLASSEDGESDHAFYETLSALPYAEAKSALLRRLRQEAAHIMRMSADEIDPMQSLGSLGLDSLMGLELHLAIEKAVGVQTPMIGASDKSLMDLTASILGYLGLEAEKEVA